MKDDITKFPEPQLRDASYKFKLYLNKITSEAGSHKIIEKICHLAIESYLKFIQSEQFIFQNYLVLKQAIIEKRSYYLLYILDILIKSNRFVMGLAKKDLEGMFRTVWEKVSLQYARNLQKIQCMKAMVRTWGLLFSAKFGIQQSIKNWLKQKYNTDITLCSRYQILYQQFQGKQKNTKENRLQTLISELTRDDSSK